MMVEKTNDEQLIEYILTSFNIQTQMRDVSLFAHHLKDGKKE